MIETWGTNNSACVIVSDSTSSNKVNCFSGFFNNAPIETAYSKPTCSQCGIPADIPFLYIPLLTSNSILIVGLFNCLDA